MTTAYAELIERLRHHASAIETDDAFTSADFLREAADALAALTRELEEARVGLRLSADQVEKLAFQMPPPNNWTPQFVGLAHAMRAYEHGLSRERAAE